MKCPKCGNQVMSYHRFCWNCGVNLKDSTARKRRQRIANLLEKKIKDKPWDDYILIDKNLLWKIISLLEGKRGDF